MEIFFLLVALELALPANGQCAAFHTDVQVLRLNAGYLELQHQLARILIHIHGGDEVPGGKLILLLALGPRKVRKD